MGVLLQAFYRLGTAGVPSPLDGDPAIPFWWDHLAAQASALREVGFTALWLPPILKGGSGRFSVGYDVFDDYDLGGKDQMGGVPTRYGSREQLARCVATLRACGLDAYLDLVENQRSGGVNFRYRYKGAGGAQSGRFPKDPDNFHPHVPQDPGVFGGPRTRETSFGDDLAIINARPAGYVSKGLADAAAWVTRALDVQGFRLDDAKGISTEFVPRLLTTPPLAGKFAVGEFFDGDIGLLGTWTAAVGRHAAAFDFPLRFTLARMCNQSGGFDMGGALDHAGYAGIDPQLAVTFVENHDTDTRPELSPVVANKMLAYAYILTSEGYPCVFYRDYSHDPGCYGLKPFIDNLIWVHEKLADGPTQERWKEVGLFVYERLGGAHLLTGLNKDDWQERVVTVDTAFGPHVQLHDYTGHSPDVWTDGDGRATISIPANRGGLGYACFSRNGFGEAFVIHESPVVQEIEGAADLDVAPAGFDTPTTAGRIWVERGKPLTIELRHLDIAHFSPQSAIELVVEGPDGKPLAQQTFAHAAGTPLHARAAARGWHRLTVQARNTPPKNRTPAFTLTVTYTAPRGGPL